MIQENWIHRMTEFILFSTWSLEYELEIKEKYKYSNLQCVYIMPITDAIKKQIAQKRRLFYKICFKCGGRNPISSGRCRKCHSQHMRLKNRNVGAKK